MTAQSHPRVALFFALFSAIQVDDTLMNNEHAPLATYLFQINLYLKPLVNARNTLL